MAGQFMQSGSVPQIQGSIGNQQVIQDRSPTLEGVTNSALGVVDTLGTKYSQYQAEKYVKEELENMDSAVAAAEQGAFTVGDEVPESLKYDQEQWDMLAGAVQSGQMPRETARLIASSRLRARIAEEPFFADRMRKAASGVLGFNIESESAQQYFNSFQTKAQIANAASANKNTYLTKVDERAVAQATYLGVDVDVARKDILAADRAKDQLDAINTQKELGQISASEEISQISKIDSEVAMTGILKDLAVSIKEGVPIDNVVVGNEIETKKQMFLQAARKKYDGDINSPEFKRIEESINSRYDGYNTLIQAVGVDNLTASKISRMEQLRQNYADTYMMDIQLANEIGGQAAVEQYFRYTDPNVNETQKAQMLQQFPVLRRLSSVMNATPQQLQARINTTAAKLANRAEMSDEEKEVIDPAASAAYTKGDEDTQTSVIQTLRREGMPTKGNSLIASKTPKDTSADNIATFKKGFEKDVPLVLKSIGRTIAEYPEALSTFERTDGSIGIKMSSSYGEGEIGGRAKRADALKALESANQELNKLRPYWKSLDNGWENTLGTSRDEFALQNVKTINDEASRISSNRDRTEYLTSIKDFSVQAVAGEYEQARELFEQIKAKNPDSFPNGFDAVYQEIRRLKAEGGQ